MGALPQVDGLPVDTDELADAVVVAGVPDPAPAPASTPTPLLIGTQGAMGIRKRRARSGTPRARTAEETQFLVGRMQDFVARPGKFRNRGRKTRHMPWIKTIEELPGLARFEATHNRGNRFRLACEDGTWSRLYKLAEATAVLGLLDHLADNEE